MIDHVLELTQKGEADYYANAKCSVCGLYSPVVFSNIGHDNNYAKIDTYRARCLSCTFESPLQ